MHPTRHERLAADDLGPLPQHHLFVPASLWALALLLACLSSLLDTDPAHDLAHTQRLYAAAAQPG